MFNKNVEIREQNYSKIIETFGVISSNFHAHLVLQTPQATENQ